MRRVVVTGMGVVTPLGVGAEYVWNRLLKSESGIQGVQSCDVSDLPCKIAGEVPRGDTASGKFNADDYVSPKDQKKMDTFIVMAMGAAQQAVEDSGWKPTDEEGQTRTGVLIGSGIGGLTGIQDTTLLEKEKGPRRVSPFFIPGSLINLASGLVSIQHGFKGPNHAVVTACATGTHAIGDAARIIAVGDADVMVAGGAESAICRIGIAGFIACKALSSAFNDTPEKASRPYDKDRDGFVMGEGAGILVLEEYEHAKARGAKIYCEVIGYGMSGDAYHITAPSEDGDGAFRCMQAAIKRAGISAGEIDYINAHGTSTPAGDSAEIRVIKVALGEEKAYRTPISSTKGATGHCLGAAGAVEATFTVLALQRGVLPPTINQEVADPECDLDTIPNEAREQPIEIALSNSFGFGGHNACIVLRRWAESDA